MMKKILLLIIVLTTLLNQPGKAQTQPCFNTPVTYSPINKPTIVVSADFNGDSKPDLAVGNNAANNISIHINQGSGSFSITATYTTAGDPEALTSADFNGDGKPDLAVCNNTGGSLSVFINSGSGSFSPAVNYSAGYYTGSSITSADFNGDGKPDLAMTGDLGIYSSPRVAVFMNTGSGTFSPAVLYNPGSSILTVITSSDFNGDGKADIAVNAWSNTIVFLNNGSGAFLAPVFYSTTSQAIGIVSGDLNSDGLSDIAVTSWNDAVDIFLNAGGGTFNPKFSIGVPNAPFGIIRTDLNSDSKPDLAVQTADGIVGLINNGSGTFNKTAAYKFYASALSGVAGYYGYGSNKICSADFDGNGTPDVAGVIPYACTQATTSQLDVILHCVTPIPPLADFSNLPSSVCLGSNVNANPTITGTPPQTSYLAYPLISPQVDTAIAICKNNHSVFVLFAGDSVRRYNSSGNYQFTYPFLPLGSHAIAADNNDRLFVVGPDNLNPAISQITCFDASGNMDFTFWNSGPTTDNYILNYIAGIAIGPDNKLYAADTLADIKVLTTDGSSQISSIPTPSNLQYSLYKPMGICFGKSGQMYVADAGNHNILARNANDNNFYPVFPGMNAAWEPISLEVDTAHNSFYFVTRNIPHSVIMAQATNSFGDTLCTYDTLSSHVTFASPGSLAIMNQNTAPNLWVSDTRSTTLNRVSEFTYQIAPALPPGLTYQILGGITGTPTSSSPLTTYTITVSNALGTTTSTVSFAVDPPGPISNSAGVYTSSTMHGDGLTVRYFSANNCSKMLEIADQAGGSMPGAVSITQTVTPTISVFNADTFINRVTSIHAQDASDSARIKIYYTYLDILHYNQSLGSTVLSNDTTGGTMQVAVLQMHESPPNSGHLTPIRHAPITATWSNVDHHWVVDFKISKFSDFYMGDTVRIGNFNCENGSSDSVVVSANYYVWLGDTLFSTGIYNDTLKNHTGCDSILTLKLTLSGMGVSQLANNNGIYVYPSPGNGVFNISMQNSSVTPTQVRVINALGEEVYNKAITGNTVVDLTAYENGVYFVILQTSDKPVIRRIIKE